MGFHLAREIPRGSSSKVTTFILLLAALWAAPSVAGLPIDFEQPYYVHPGMQVWDFCLEQSGDLYHLFYHAVPTASPHPGQADHIWHAVSDDLVHWSAPVVALSVSDAVHEATAVWAPHIAHDPDTGLWWMAYTGVDESYNQRLCLAWSPDLATWNKLNGNPVVEPDTALFNYFAAGTWSSCRDPFLYRQDGLWHLLATAEVPGDSGGSMGAVAHTSSSDLSTWSTTDVYLVNDRIDPEPVPESCSYCVFQGQHHLFYSEGGGFGVRHVQTVDPDQWSLATCALIGVGIAPEIDTFDGGAHHVISRLGQFRDHPDSTTAQFVAHFDTLQFDGGDHPTIRVTPPLQREFAAYGGDCCCGNPCLGDNPARRGEDPVRLEGNGYFGSAEMFQGPFGAGAASYGCGEAAEGYLNSHAFEVDAPFISLLVGGTDDPAHCFVALMDAQADTVLRRASGDGPDPMTRKWWDVSDLVGREVYVRIEDSAIDGHINVDDIVASNSGPSTAAPATTPAALIDLGPRPNPFNPSTTLRFRLTRATTCCAHVHDLRGRRVWTSGDVRGRVGTNAIEWSGIAIDGRRVPGGVYVYRITAEPDAVVSGKVTLVP